MLQFGNALARSPSPPLAEGQGGKKKPLTLALLQKKKGPESKAKVCMRIAPSPFGRGVG